jgi:hypothetical protein
MNGNASSRLISWRSFGGGLFMGPLISFAICDRFLPTMPFADGGILGITIAILLLLFVNEPTYEEIGTISQK